MSKVKGITDKEFHDVIKSDKIVMVDCYADWCGPCRKLGPIVDTIAEEYKDKGVTVVKMDVDANQKIPEYYGIQSIPTLLIFKDGKLAETITGAAPKQEITDVLDRLMEKQSSEETSK